MAHQGEMVSLSCSVFDLLDAFAYMTLLCSFVVALPQQLLLHALKAFQLPTASIPGCTLCTLIALCCFCDSYFVACVCSMVQCIFELPGPRDHVHLLPIGNHHRQGCQEEEEIPLVGPLFDTVSDIPVC